jgi:hypothetical protein
MEETAGMRTLVTGGMVGMAAVVVSHAHGRHFVLRELKGKPEDSEALEGTRLAARVVTVGPGGTVVGGVSAEMAETLPMAVVRRAAMAE